MGKKQAQQPEIQLVDFNYPIIDNLKMENEKQKDYLLSASIIIAALLIVGAWIYTTGLKNAELKKPTAKIVDETAPNIEKIKEISKTDHIRGDKNAQVKIVEFSDLECPFCKNFHNTMKMILSEYNGKVAWVYRHFPITQLHSKAEKSAEASECAAELGGEEKFWIYIDRYFEITPSNNQIELAQLPQIAEDIGLNRGQFENCLKNGKFKEKINSQIQDAVNSGAEGTPYSIVINKNNEKSAISGAYPYEQVKIFVEEALK